MKTPKLKGLSQQDLFKKEKESKKELFNLRFQQAAGQLENTARLSIVKKNIARIKTELRAQQIAKEKSKAK